LVNEIILYYDARSKKHQILNIHFEVPRTLLKFSCFLAGVNIVV